VEALKESKKRYEEDIEHIERDINNIKNPGTLECRSEEAVEKLVNWFKERWGISIDDPSVVQEELIREAIKYGVLEEGNLPKIPWGIAIPLPGLGIDSTREELSSDIIKSASSQLSRKQEAIREIDQYLSRFTVEVEPE
jgi:hypothetical protein